MLQRSTTVLAAGCVVWRDGPDGLEVLLVHRPRYDDWSFPKGKRDDGEPLPVTAVREVEEETGLRVRLDQQLPTAVYLLPDGRTKIVQYWAAIVARRTAKRPHDPTEIDDLRWVGLDEVDRVLTRRSDRHQTDAVRRLVAEGALRTAPVILQRHGSAVSRSRWGKDELTRPLNRKGKKQAAALTELLRAYAPEAVITSPWKRCVATLRPFTKRASIRTDFRDELTETAAKKNPDAAARIFEQAMTRGHRTVLCTHRPVLPLAISVIGARTTSAVVLELPREDPYLAAGEMLVLHVDAEGQVVALERHRPEIR